MEQRLVTILINRVKNESDVEQFFVIRLFPDALIKDYKYSIDKIFNEWIENIAVVQPASVIRPWVAGARRHPNRMRLLEKNI